MIITSLTWIREIIYSDNLSLNSFLRSVTCFRWVLMQLCRCSISCFCIERTPSASEFFWLRSEYLPSRADFVLLYLFFIARMFSLMGISSFRKLSSSLTPSRSISSLSFSNFSSYSMYFIYSCTPPIYSSSSTFWLGLFFRFVTVV